MSDDQNQPLLSDADLDALDALVESGFSERSETADDRTARLRSLLALLDTPVPAESDRATRVSLADLQTRRAHEPQKAQAPFLGAEDEAAVDHWMRHDGSAPPASLAIRVQRQEAFARLATGGIPADASARTDLIERTMAAALAAETAQHRRMVLEDQPAPTGSRFRMTDLISVAATLLIVGSVALPAFQGVTRAREQAACQTNMQAAARAFGSYAGDNADMMPMATAGFGGSWMDVGTPDRSNSANLYTLARTAYARLDDLACPTNPNATHGNATPDSMDWRTIDELSYSYRIMPTGGLRMTMAVPTTDSVVLTADRSPVTLRVSQGLRVYPEANTPNHDGRGQHVLRLDGSAVWTTSPVMSGDNIWLPHQVETIIRQVRSHFGLIEGTEMPGSATDAFVGP
jgi:hypothetical protein